MKIFIRGDKVEVTDSIREYVLDKLSKLDKYFTKSDEISCTVIIRVKNGLQTLEVTIPTSRFTIRCEEGQDDLYAAIDIIVDKLERMIRKNKTRLTKHYKDVPTFEMYFEETIEYADEDEEKDLIAKRKNIDTKPMSEEEAILQIELLNHDFFVFKNADENCTSVLYKRKDNTYGIINVK